MFHTVINSLYKVLGGYQQPRVHAIFDSVIRHIGPKIHLGITNQFTIQFKVLFNLVYHGHSIMMNDKYVFNISQDVGVVVIAVNVKFGIDPHVWVG